MMRAENKRLVWAGHGETIWIEPWGPDAIRVRARLIRPVFFDFPEDLMAWELPEQHMFGPDVLVAPVMYPGQRVREVYLPAGAMWLDLRTGQEFSGGQHILADAPLESIPVFLRDGRHREWIVS